MENGSSLNAKTTWLGIPAAFAAFAQNARYFAAPHPGTPLRVLSLIAITAALRSRGMVLQPGPRRALIDMMELGALLNDRFDGDPCQPADVRKRISAFSRSFHRDCICSYIIRLRHFERSRPSPDALSEDVKSYRENVNLVSLATLWAIASHQPIREAENDIRQQADLRLLFRIVMLAQVIDDVLDIRKDRRRGLPSFATAADSNLPMLKATVRLYRDPAPLGWDGNFCLHLMLRIAARSARTTIRLGSAMGRIPA